MRAWKNQDGNYRLGPRVTLGPPRDEYDPEFKDGALRAVGGRFDDAAGRWILPAEGVAGLGIRRVFGVVAGPTDCGCSPAIFSYVGEDEVGRGRTDLEICLGCSRRARERGGPIRGVFVGRDIIDICGEADEARAVYDAEFKSRIEG
jgi:hypothetical protein